MSGRNLLHDADGPVQILLMVFRLFMLSVKTTITQFNIIVKMAFRFTVVLLLISWWCITSHAQVLCGRLGGTGPCPPGYKRDEFSLEESATVDAFPRRFSDPYFARKNKATRADYQPERQLFEGEEKTVTLLRKLRKRLRSGLRDTSLSIVA